VRSRLLQNVRDTKGLQALILLLLLALYQWLVATELRTPEAFLAWVEDLSDRHARALILGALDDMVAAIVTAWYVVPVLVALTLVFWLLRYDRVMLVPLALYCAWSTVLAIASVAILAATILSPQATGQDLLLDAAQVLLGNWVVFGTWYWLLDEDNQRERVRGGPANLNFLFAPQSSALPGWENWKPNIVDYLWLSFVTTAQFGPSDTLVLTRPAKLLVMLQATLGLVSIVLIIARATNIIQ
jgi:hypothetical protein